MADFTENYKTLKQNIDQTFSETHSNVENVNRSNVHISQRQLVDALPPNFTDNELMEARTMLFENAIQNTRNRIETMAVVEIASSALLFIENILPQLDEKSRKIVFESLKDKLSFPVFERPGLTVETESVQVEVQEIQEGIVVNEPDDVTKQNVFQEVIEEILPDINHGVEEASLKKIELVINEQKSELVQENKVALEQEKRSVLDFEKGSQYANLFDLLLAEEFAKIGTFSLKENISLEAMKNAILRLSRNGKRDIRISNVYFDTQSEESVLNLLKTIRKEKKEFGPYTTTNLNYSMYKFRGLEQSLENYFSLPNKSREPLPLFFLNLAEENEEFSLMPEDLERNLSVPNLLQIVLDLDKKNKINTKLTLYNALTIGISTGIFTQDDFSKSFAELLPNLSKFRIEREAEFSKRETNVEVVEEIKEEIKPDETTPKEVVTEIKPVEVEKTIKNVKSSSEILAEFLNEKIVAGENSLSSLLKKHAYNYVVNNSKEYVKEMYKYNYDVFTWVQNIFKEQLISLYNQTKDIQIIRDAGDVIFDSFEKILLDSVIPTIIQKYKDYAISQGRNENTTNELKEMENAAVLAKYTAEARSFYQFFGDLLITKHAEYIDNIIISDETTPGDMTFIKKNGSFKGVIFEVKPSGQTEESKYKLFNYDEYKEHIKKTKGIKRDNLILEANELRDYQIESPYLIDVRYIYIPSYKKSLYNIISQNEWRTNIDFEVVLEYLKNCFK